MNKIIFNKKEIKTDLSGYLININDWSKDLAVEIAFLEGIILNKDHWQIIYFVRNFYIQYNISPAIKILLKAMSNNFDYKKTNSRYLFRLFPKGPAKQATKIAGLPKPIHCI